MTPGDHKRPRGSLTSVAELEAITASSPGAVFYCVHARRKHPSKAALESWTRVTAEPVTMPAGEHWRVLSGDRVDDGPVPETGQNHIGYSGDLHLEENSQLTWHYLFRTRAAAERWLVELRKLPDRDTAMMEKIFRDKYLSKKELFKEMYSGTVTGRTVSRQPEFQTLKVRPSAAQHALLMETYPKQEYLMQKYSLLDIDLTASMKQIDEDYRRQLLERRALEAIRGVGKRITKL